MLNRLMQRLRLAMVAPMLAGAVAGMAPAALAEDWPSRAVTLVVPYGPGASNDTFTRAIAEVLSEDLGQPFVVENRVGAGGFIGSNSVKNAEGDGYIFLEAPGAIVGLGPIGKMDLDVLADFKPVALLATSPTAMAINSSIPADTVEEFIAWVEENPDKAFYGFAGVGATSHLHAELFNHLAGTDLQGVNYKSSADAQADLAAGRLAAMFVSVASTKGQVDAGQLKLLAYADDNYPEGSPEAPTMAEAGVEGYEIAQLFWAMFAPKDTPDDIVAKMNDALNKALEDPAVVDLMMRSGATPTPGEPSALTDILEAEMQVLEDFQTWVELE
ncbi:MAG TPA: tripartite tricarboxylate transporter substrate binding protein [Devosiaceae bacterium]|jgi:tripartite-type tricarboxylate transporter receptor subunit TctC|nr:tripartite tricarboxylate transporter substrate binding protein [Devosiaceae bacterium]